MNVKNVATSRTTQNVGIAAGVVAGAIKIVRGQWPDLVFWPESADFAVESGIYAVFVPLLSRILAFLRTPEKKDRGHDAD